jgi:uncharacterized protein (TIGR04255 family)
VTLAEPPTPADQPVNFQDPPVTEVVLAIQFAERVVDLEVLAEFTRRVKDDFPGRSQRQPLPPMQEEAVEGQLVPQISLEFTSEFQMPRTWFASEDETKILQLQEDRFVFNWQRPDPNAADYPRYRTLREWFRERLGQLEASVAAAGKEMPGTNFCEVTYVNQVAPGDGEERLGLADILSPIQRPDYGFLPAPENQQYGARFRIGAAEDGPRGALYVSSAPATRPDGTPIHVINLTSRLVPGESDPEAAWNALDLGREWIVKGFVDLTTKEMHRRWGYEEGVDD